MTLRNLFDAANTRGSISTEKLAEIKNLIATIQAKTAEGEHISIDDQDTSGDTALIIATRRRHDDIVQLLLNAKAKTHIENLFGATALMEAVENRDLKITELLLDAGAQIENGTKYTALDRAIDLHLSSLQDHFDNAIDLTDQLSIIRALLKHGAFIHHPQQLFEFLNYCDARDPNLLDTVHFLYEHLKLGYEPQSLLGEVKEFIDDLDITTEAHKINFVDFTEITMKELLPTDLRQIVYSYDAPLERFGFFRLRDPLPEEKTEPNLAEEKPESEKSKNTCSVM